MAKEMIILDTKERLNNTSDLFELDVLEESLQNQLEGELSDMQFLVEEKEKIGSLDNLGKVIQGVIWEQFLNQIASIAGEDFIEKNRGLTLDLRDEAHIQTTENFAKGKIARHNTKIDYQQRYDDWQSKFEKDGKGNIVTHITRAGNEEANLVNGARAPFDKGRPKGSTENHTDIDHTIPAAEIIRDPAANAHMTEKEQVTFANSDVNLNEIDSSYNRSKGDKSMTEWLDNPNAKGQKPNEIFNISETDEKELRQKDAKARKEYEREKKEAEKRSIDTGKQSQKEETFRITGEVLRAVIMQLLAELVKEIITKLVKWFKSAKKTWKSLCNGVKEAIHSFISKMKTHLINAADTVFSTVATAIMGPIVRMIKKVWAMLKQGWKSLRNTVAYIKDPVNKGKPIGMLLMEAGKIVIAGIAGMGAILLGEIIEKGLMSIPIFCIEIPVLGNLASVLGIFFGAVVAGIIGAIAIHIIEKQIAKKLKRENVRAQIETGNEILRTQYQLQVVNEGRVGYTKAIVAQNICDRHVAAAHEMADSLKVIKENCATDINIEDSFNNIDKLFAKLED